MENFKETYTHANLLYNIGKVDKALDLYVKLFNEDSTRVDILRKILWITFNKHDFDKADKYIDLYLDKFPHDLDVLSAKVCVLFNNKSFHEALTVCNKMIEIDSNSTIAYSFKLSILEVLKRNTERQEIIDFLRKDKPEIFKEINYFDDNSNKEASVDKLCKELENQKASSRFRDFFDDLYYNDLDDLTLYDYLVYDNKEDNNKEFNTLFSKAKEYFDTEDYSKSLDYIKWSLEFYPNNIEALIFKSIVLLKIYNYNQVLNTVNLVLELDKKNIPALAIKGLVNIDLEKYDDAEEVFKTALDLDLDNVNLWRTYYMSLALNNKINKAFELNNDAISRFPKNQELHKDRKHFIDEYGLDDDKKSLNHIDNEDYEVIENTVNSTLDDFFR
ncbi:hypothetical protein BGI41_01745 [Methanobrevibacter sp. 87.7]|uniref:tetratricopeptide repeat protein n=1 Tax=Methanobrevibacter sp. 87.7 TaxID=387957 RepID=UPI000B5121C7|nr:hypothetical protein [Methanobrevibacter sp. 87.7]OWT33577.1 hypothetical protein BGI41_01745 [Methanobrevibacter sp. 87.7]